ncbi:ShlB/FhaC/HecB family hemolysin secretion/activation protein [Rhizobium straminoryzae]|uniref:ShlB/FhaC/HecB family hemolysin secretion/activation protein n=1 Tax=Rhizobium straminoryzae TaxID=1387186 RepID=A0A549SUX2_9HYPH|nr:POTRA domain-containing protein [Rhizobium straminoryzae]TRL33432.1 ShlB/FhaC/HecB family hemolysin secretion/activation protein [Rhizobium straminoryzae]
MPARLMRAGAMLFGLSCGLVAVPAGAAPALPTVPATTDADINNPRAVSDFEQRERQRALERATDQQPVAPSAPGQEEVAVPKGAERASFVLKDVAFNDSRVFTKTDLDAIVAPYLNRKISVADLFRLTAKINATYRERGYITAQAVLVPQQIAGGHVRIQLVEGTIGAVEVSGNKKVRSDVVIDHVEVLPGSIPTIQLIERRLAAVNQNRKFQVTAGLKPGKETGTTDLQLQVTGEPKPFSGTVYLNNQGTRDSGRYTLGATASLYSPFGYDETISAGLTTSVSDMSNMLQDFDVGSYFFDADLPMPVGNGGLRLLYSHSDSKVLEGSFASLGVLGRGDLVSLTYTQPFYTTPTWNFSTVSGGQWSNTHSEVSTVDTDTLSFRVFGGVKGQATFPTTGTYIETELRLIQSWVDTKGLSGHDRDTITRMVGSATLFQSMGDGLSLMMRAGGQYTPEKRLPSGELWYLGGVSTLPAYELSSLSGDNGLYLANQIRYSSDYYNSGMQQALGIPFSSGIRAFIDVGAVFDDYLRGESSSFYSDAGFGLDFDIGGHLSGDLSVAWAIDPKMNSNIKVDSPRFLFTLTTSF